MLFRIVLYELLLEKLMINCYNLITIWCYIKLIILHIAQVWLAIWVEYNVLLIYVCNLILYFKNKNT